MAIAKWKIITRVGNTIIMVCVLCMSYNTQAMREFDEITESVNNVNNVHQSNDHELGSSNSLSSPAINNHRQWHQTVNPTVHCTPSSLTTRSKNHQHSYCRKRQVSTASRQNDTRVLDRWRNRTIHSQFHVTEMGKSDKPNGYSDTHLMTRIWHIHNSLV